MKNTLAYYTTDLINSFLLDKPLQQLLIYKKGLKMAFLIVAEPSNFAPQWLQLCLNCGKVFSFSFISNLILF